MLVAASLAAGIAALGGLAYWELVVAEGVHLGPRMVTWLYDLVARRYNSIKQFDPEYETWFLGEPLAQALSLLRDPIVLDVATGTGRLPLTLLPQGNFDGRIIGVDSSRAMLAEAAQELESAIGLGRLALVWQSATRLPLPDGAVDCVTCLEALEFMPDTRQALAEIVRVLRPGGITLLTNRIGSGLKLMPGHTQSSAGLEAMLSSLGLDQIITQRWQVDYDLVWAHKPSAGAPPALVHKPVRLEDLLRCPQCSGQLEFAQAAFRCTSCTRTYSAAADGVIEMATSRGR